MAYDCASWVLLHIIEVKPPNVSCLLSYFCFLRTQPSYLHNLVTVQPPRSTCCSSLVTLARPSTSSSLRIIDRSFQYVSPRVWNQLSASLRQPRTNLSIYDSPNPLSGTSSIGSIDSPLSSSITPHFHSRLKTFPFLQILPTAGFFFFFRTDSTDSLDCLPILLSISV